MPEIDIEGDRLVVHLSGLQAVMALARHVSVPLAGVREVVVVDDGWHIDLGWRVGGTGIPRRLAFGRYRASGGRRTFAALDAGVPAVLVDADDGEWDRLAITVDDAQATAARIRAAAGLI